MVSELALTDLGVGRAISDASYIRWAFLKG
jgi:hypothetical protein